MLTGVETSLRCRTLDRQNLRGIGSSSLVRLLPPWTAPWGHKTDHGCHHISKCVKYVSCMPNFEFQAWYYLWQSQVEIWDKCVSQYCIGVASKVITVKHNLYTLILSMIFNTFRCEGVGKKRLTVTGGSIRCTLLSSISISLCIDRKIKSKHSNDIRD